MSCPTHFYSKEGHELVLNCMTTSRKGVMFSIDFVLPNGELASKVRYQYFCQIKSPSPFKSPV